MGAIYESLAEAADVKGYPPPGELVDVGGYRLHIHCTGTGSPTVVIAAGLGDWSTTWGSVQREVANTARKGTAYLVAERPDTRALYHGGTFIGRTRCPNICPGLFCGGGRGCASGFDESETDNPIASIGTAIPAIFL